MRKISFALFALMALVAMAVPVTITTVPAQSMVYVNGTLIGQTDNNGVLSFDLNGPARITVDDIGYFPTTVSFVPSASATSITVMLKQMSYLSITSSPTNAMVSIDGGSETQSPATVTVAAGPHAVKVTKNGYLPKSFTVTTKPFGMISRSVILEKAGRITFQGSPVHSMVWMDGFYIGTTPFSTIISPGEHRLKYLAKGYQPKTSSLKVDEGATPLTIFFELTQLATVTIKSSPTGASVAMAGIEFTAPATLVLPVGTYTYSASRIYSYPSTGTLKITGSGSYAVDLPPILSTVLFTSNPQGAAVELDGNLAGQTPFSKQLPYGRYFVKMINPGNKVWFGNVTVDQQVKTIYGDTLNSGMVVIDAQPRQNTVVHLGQIWTTLPATLSAAVGIYPIEFLNPNYPSQTKYIQIRGGIVSDVFADLQPMSTLFLNSSPLGATVTIDNRVIGRTPLFDLKLKAGEHQIVLKWSDGTLEKRVILQKDAVYTLSYKNPNNVKIRFFSYPDPVKVFVDGTDEGYTPFSMTLTRGLHRYESYDVEGKKIGSGELNTTTFASETYIFVGK